MAQFHYKTVFFSRSKRFPAPMTRWLSHTNLTRIPWALSKISLIVQGLQKLPYVLPQTTDRCTENITTSLRGW